MARRIPSTAASIRAFAVERCKRWQCVEPPRDAIEPHLSDGAESHRIQRLDDEIASDLGL